jgi:hypothetical protein
MEAIRLVLAFDYSTKITITNGDYIQMYPSSRKKAVCMATTIVRGQQCNQYRHPILDTHVSETVW